MVDENSIQAVRDKWGLRIPKSYKKLKGYLDRPLRVCGMVRNEGEPGGGPFWCHDDELGESLQVVEQSQIDQSDQQQSMMLKNSTHFNPVDLVCSLRTLRGKEIDLTRYVNDSQYFIAS